MVEIDINRRRKRLKIEELLKGEYLLVQINTSCDGVVLPEHLSSLFSVTLKLSRLFRGGMWVSDEQIIAELLFNGVYFTCHLPLDSVWSASNDKGTSEEWPDARPGRQRNIETAEERSTSPKVIRVVDKDTPESTIPNAEAGDDTAQEPQNPLHDSEGGLPNNSSRHLSSREAHTSKIDAVTPSIAKEGLQQDNEATARSGAAGKPTPFLKRVK